MSSQSSTVQYIGQNLYIRPTYIVSLPEYDFPSRGMSLRFLQNMENLKDNKHGGQISKKADKGIKNAINWILCQAEPKRVFRQKTNSWFTFKVNFITLTLPDTVQVINERAFKTKLLNPWLTLMRTAYGLKNYVWKVEFQKNGKLHLHLTTDTFLHHATIRRTWNKLLGRNGYLADFYLKHGHSNPNSTDVHSVRKIKNLGAYLAKYMSKNEFDAGKVRGKIWGCNTEISKANKTVLHLWPDECAAGMAPLMSRRIQYEPLMRPHPLTQLLTKFGEKFLLSYNDWIHRITGPIKDKFNEVINGLRNLAHDGSLFTDLAVV